MPNYGSNDPDSTPTTGGAELARIGDAKSGLGLGLGVRLEALATANVTIKALKNAAIDARYAFRSSQQRQ